MNKIAVALFALVAVAAAGVVREQQAAILTQDGEVNPDGSFHHHFETENGIVSQEEGHQEQAGNDLAQRVRGASSYTAPDGTQIRLTYTADENGFHPEGEHLPVGPAAPEIPPAIARALEWIAAHPYKEPEY